MYTTYVASRRLVNHTPRFSRTGEHRATLLRRAARAAHGRAGARGAGARESVGSAEARVRPSRPSSAPAARARATRTWFVVRKGRPEKKRTLDDAENGSSRFFGLSRHKKGWIFDLEIRRAAPEARATRPRSRRERAARVRHLPSPPAHGYASVAPVPDTAAGTAPRPLGARRRR